MYSVKAIDKNTINQAITRIGTDFTQRIAHLGFIHTKKWYWVRPHQNYADFIHLHRQGSSYGGQINYSISFRAYCGIRVFNDSFEALALNGPNSDSSDAMEHRYHLRFNAKSGSTYDRCIDDLFRFVIEFGEPWFMSNVPACHINNEQNADIINFSLKLLGIKTAKTKNC